MGGAIWNIRGWRDPRIRLVTSAHGFGQSRRPWLVPLFRRPPSSVRFVAQTVLGLKGARCPFHGTRQFCSQMVKRPQHEILTERLLDEEITEDDLKDMVNSGLVRRTTAWRALNQAENRK